MPPRLCIKCGKPTHGRQSRHRACGGRSQSPRRHDARQTTFRKAVLKNFRPGDPCGKCGLPIWDLPDAGHIIALSAGGSYDPTNGQPEHRNCNRADGARLARGRGGRFSPEP